MIATVVSALPSPSQGSIGIGPVRLRAYGLCIAGGATAGVRIAMIRFRQRGGAAAVVESIAWWAIPAGLVGARVYHVATDWRTYRGRWLDALAIWQGGLGIWGGVALGAVVGCVIARRKGAPVLVLLDVAAPAIAVAQAIGRWGNWFNQELFGRRTSVPRALRIDAASRIGTLRINEIVAPGVGGIALAFVIALGRVRARPEPAGALP